MSLCAVSALLGVRMTHKISEDLGSITVPATETLDYGLITEPADAVIDDGLITEAPGDGGGDA